ncbi:MAG: FkbM family methyltransferase [Nitrospinaceae bacterium]|jgi:FkbM family methyltransferase|nr:FkbM family methyltransferase [Nitrospinaceae bacterium]MBT3435921.1 FkbM family methyltransferase [Nitrospinaceae bacterium]MBT3821601.1 FkbM family methyltransferase [Nitrospinaceae bacterium]MBT5366749.1 FkbM family methyltransferase [Nitrospinaceae bacterium]
MENEFNVVVSCRDGEFIANKNDIYVGRSLIKYGEFSYQEMVLFKALCEPSDVIIEAGANIGAHTVGLAKLVGLEGRVVAIEPQATLYQNLCGNISINSLTNVDCLNLALSNEAGTALVPHFNYVEENNYGGVAMGSNEAGYEVQQMRLDDLFRFPKLKFLKIDVEGMEKKVLEGAENIIKQFSPVMYIENDRLDRSKDLIEHLFSLDYDLWWHITPLFNENNFNGDTENIYLGVSSVNMLCIHASAKAKIDLPKIEDSGQHPVN